jgi:hypothetical protein
MTVYVVLTNDMCEGVFSTMEKALARVRWLKNHRISVPNLRIDVETVDSPFVAS